jgi:hypothetical protein
MKFFGSRITTKSVSLEDAIARAKEPQKARSLDEILAGIDAKNKQVKVASSTEVPAKAEEPKAEVKTASTSAPEVKAEAKAEPKDEPKVEVKVAMEEKAAGGDFGGKKAPPFGKKDEDKDEDKKDKKDEDDKDDDKKEKEAGCTAAAKPGAQKWAKSLDFRQWEAADVVGAWGQHGSTEKCASNVKGKVSDPKVYCELLKTAAGQADKMIKAAAAKSKSEKKAGVFKKIAKMTDDEKSWLADYYGELYGKEYVDALLADY